MLTERCECGGLVEMDPPGFFAVDHVCMGWATVDGWCGTYVVYHDRPAWGDGAFPAAPGDVVSHPRHGAGMAVRVGRREALVAFVAPELLARVPLAECELDARPLEGRR